jgi:hypothetical protein
MELIRQVGNEPPLVGLMRVFKDYYPDIIVGHTVSGRASVFTVGPHHPRHGSANFDSIQTGNGVSGLPIYKLSLSIEIKQDCNPKCHFVSTEVAQLVRTRTSLLLYHKFTLSVLTRHVSIPPRIVYTNIFQVFCYPGRNRRRT